MPTRLPFPGHARLAAEEESDSEMDEDEDGDLDVARQRRGSVSIVDVTVRSPKDGAEVGDGLEAAALAAPDAASS